MTSGVQGYPQGGAPGAIRCGGESHVDRAAPTGRQGRRKAAAAPRSDAELSGVRSGDSDGAHRQIHRTGIADDERMKRRCIIPGGEIFSRKYNYTQLITNH